MKLSVREYEAMQMGWRKWYIEKIELKQFRKYGLAIRDKDILEVGCGNGCREGPHSYTGIDVMKEQLDKARSLEIPGAKFIEASASDLSIFPDRSFDAVLDFCILHHVEGWRDFLDEAHRVLRDDGSLYVADLSKKCIHIVDGLLHWDHNEEALFTFKEFEEEAKQRGFRIVHKASDLGLENYYRFDKR